MLIIIVTCGLVKECGKGSPSPMCIIIAEIQVAVGMEGIGFVHSIPGTEVNGSPQSHPLIIDAAYPDRSWFPA